MSGNFLPRRVPRRPSSLSLPVGPVGPRARWRAPLPPLTRGRGGAEALGLGPRRSGRQGNAESEEGFSVPQPRSAKGGGPRQARSRGLRWRPAAPPGPARPGGRAPGAGPRRPGERRGRPAAEGPGSGRRESPAAGRDAPGPFPARPRRARRLAPAGRLFPSFVALFALI